MSKFFELLKVNISLAVVQLNIGRLTRNKKRGFSSMYVLLFSAILIVAYMGWVDTMLYGSVGPYGFGWMLVAMGLVMVSLFTLATGIYTVNSVLFESQDLDQLFSYPISPKQIMFSKLMALVAENWIIGLAFYLPALAVYSYHAKPDPAFYLYAILAFICLPLIPVCLFILFAYFLNLVVSGKRAKHAINAILTFGLIFAASFGIQEMITSIKVINLNFSDLIGEFKNFYPPLGYLTSGIVKENPGDLMIGLAWNILPFVVLCLLLSFGYKALWTRSTAVSKSKGKALTFGIHSPVSTLVQKEFSRFLSSVMYILNSSIGMILMTLFAVLSATGGARLQNLKSLFPGDMKILFVLLIFGFVLVLTNTTAPSISLEGKNLWIIKSWPVGEGEILMAKLIVHLAVTLPLLAVNCVIIGFTLQLNMADSVIVFLLCALFASLSGLIGLIFNLYFHRFDFYNDTQVVKNSASVLLTYLTMALIMGVFTGIYWLFRANIVQAWFLVCVGVTLVLFTVAAALFVFTKGKNIFRTVI